MKKGLPRWQAFFVMEVCTLRKDPILLCKLKCPQNYKLLMDDLLVAARETFSHLAKKLIHTQQFSIRDCWWMPFPSYFAKNGYLFNFWKRYATEQLGNILASAFKLFRQAQFPR